MTGELYAPPLNLARNSREKAWWSYIAKKLMGIEFRQINGTYVPSVTKTGAGTLTLTATHYARYTYTHPNSLGVAPVNSEDLGYVDINFGIRFDVTVDVLLSVVVSVPNDGEFLDVASGDVMLGYGSCEGSVVMGRRFSDSQIMLFIPGASFPVANNQDLYFTGRYRKGV